MTCPWLSLLFLDLLLFPYWQEFGQYRRTWGNFVEPSYDLGNKDPVQWRNKKKEVWTFSPTEYDSSEGQPTSRFASETSISALFMPLSFLVFVPHSWAQSWPVQHTELLKLLGQYHLLSILSCDRMLRKHPNFRGVKKWRTCSSWKRMNYIHFLNWVP